MILERLEADAFRRAVDLQSALRHTDDAGRLELEQPRSGGDLGRAVRRERLGIEPLQIREAPRLVAVVGSGSAR